MSIYGVYKKVRDAAWQCLIDYKITSLPVDLLWIAKEAGITIRKNSEVDELTGCENGVCILDGGKWYLIYDDECTVGRRRFTIAHELGHIFLGHELTDGHHGRSFHILKPRVESEADMFASRLLAPACVLWGLNIHTAEEIEKACNISVAASKVRSKRMIELYERNKFLTSPLERKVFAQFEDFIESMKSNY